MLTYCSKHFECIISFKTVTLRLRIIPIWQMKKLRYRQINYPGSNSKYVHYLIIAHIISHVYINVWERDNLKCHNHSIRAFFEHSSIIKKIISYFPPCFQQTSSRRSCFSYKLIRLRFFRQECLCTTMNFLMIHIRRQYYLFFSTSIDTIVRLMSQVFSAYSSWLL